MLRFLPKAIFFLLLYSIFPASVISSDYGNRPGICNTFARPKEFSCMEYEVLTEDLFVLSLQRISSPNVPAKLDVNPVFLYHGIMQGGDVWVINEAKESLAFILAEAGYDVWIGNTRSSDFSAGHLLYTPSQQEYWDWTFDDIVAEDFPTMLRLISSATNKHVLFVGFSQGTMAGFAAFTRRKVSTMVDKAVMLSPIAFLSNIRSLVARMASSLFLDQVDLALGVKRFSLSDDLVHNVLSLACHNTNSNCYEDLLTLVEGPNCCINQSRIEYYRKYELQSTSMKNVVQLAQKVRSGRFCKYDYGLLGNLFHYSTFIPPSYNLKRLPKDMEFLFAYGGNDYLANTEDVMRLESEIPGKVEMLYMPGYSHGDFVLGTRAYIDVYPAVLSFFESNSSR